MFFLFVFINIQHAPGVPKILVGNRLHLAYKRQVTTENAQAFAERLGVTFFEVSPLCNFNITESFTELARIVLMRHGMERLWRPNKGTSTKLKYDADLGIYCITCDGRNVFFFCGWALKTIFWLHLLKNVCPHPDRKHKVQSFGTYLK